VSRGEGGGGGGVWEVGRREGWVIRDMLGGGGDGVRRGDGDEV